MLIPQELQLSQKNEASLLRDMVNQVKIVKQACRKEQAQHLQWSGRGLKVLFHATKIVFLTNSPKFSNWAIKSYWPQVFKLNLLYFVGIHKRKISKNHWFSEIFFNFHFWFVHPQGFEPWTHWLRVSCSTNWAKSAFANHFLLYTLRDSNPGPTD